jgi:hypothetical protein
LADFGENALAADFGGDQVGVLAAEIDDCDGILFHIPWG